MEYLVIRVGRLDIKNVKAIVRKFYPNVKGPSIRSRTIQFYVPNGELTKAIFTQIASELDMRVIRISKASVIIGY